MRRSWYRPIGQLRAGDYGLGGRSFFVSGAKCQAPEHECLAPQAKTLRAGGWPAPALVRVGPGGLGVFAQSSVPGSE